MFENERLNSVEDILNLIIDKTIIVLDYLKNDNNLFIILTLNY
jgi:hypothetical protein